VTPETETHQEIHKSGHRWIDLSVAGCALIVSITSVFVAIRHGRTMERMAEANARLVEANSWPILQMSETDEEHTAGERRYAWVVGNFGVGPAKVESLEVFWKGRAMPDTAALLHACCVDAPIDTDKIVQNDLHGTVLRAGESRRLIELPESVGTADMSHRLHAAYHEVTLRACYCSVFDECWMTDLNTIHPDTVHKCPVPSVPFAGKSLPSAASARP
jgi:hypothetical protein